MSDYRELLKDPRWQKKRLEIFERDKWTCQTCPETEVTLHVHHAQYFPGPPWECPNEYLITLCENCHEAEERLKGVDLYKYISDCRLTRVQIVVLFEHLKYRININEKDGVTPFETLQWLTHDVLLPEGSLYEYVRWLREERKKHG